MAGLEDAMNGATPIRSTTSTAPRAGQPRLEPRTNLRGGVLLMLAWAVLAAVFLFDVARPAPGAGAGESNATTQAGYLARSSALARSP